MTGTVALTNHWLTPAEARAFLAKRRGPFYFTGGHGLATRKAAGGHALDSIFANFQVKVERAELNAVLDRVTALEADARLSPGQRPYVLIRTNGRDTILGAQMLENEPRDLP